MDEELSPLGKAAIAYAERGWHIFPLLPGKKEPLISARMGGRAFWDATTDIVKIERWWRVTPNANIGLSLVHSGLVAVDADSYRPECEWPAFAASHDVPDTLIQRSARGGTHYIFTAPKGSDFPGKLCSFVDVKHKGYILLEPSVFDGQQYQFQTDDDPAPAPDWLFAKERPEPKSGVVVQAPSRRAEAYAKAAIASEIANVHVRSVGERNTGLNNSALKVGKFIAAGVVDRSDVTDALLAAAMESGLDEKEARTAINSGLKKGVTQQFILPEDEPIDPEVLASIERIKAKFDKMEAERLAAADAAIEAAQARRAATHIDYDSPTLAMLLTTTAGPMPDITDAAGGILREVFHYIRDAMRRDWPEAAFIVALNLVGVCIGRNFATWTDLRSNLYTVILAKSGWGKTSIYGPAIDLMVQAGLQNLIGAERIMSDSGLIQELVAQPDHKKIYFLDEFGHMLQRCNDRGAGGHIKKIVTEFTNLYSKANAFYSGSAYAEARDTSMWAPHLNIFGMATPGQFWQAFSGGAIEDGSYARFSIVSTESRPERKKLTADHLALTERQRDAIAPELGKLAATKQTTGNLGSVRAIKVMPTPGAEAMHSAMEDLTEALSVEAERSRPDKDFGAVLARAAETAAKIALILAVSENPERPMISEYHMATGRRLAWWFAHVAIGGIMMHVADSEHAALTQKMHSFIKDGGAAGRARRDLARKFKLPVKAIDDAIASLRAAEMIEVRERHREGGGGGLIVSYHAIDD